MPPILGSYFPAPGAFCSTRMTHSVLTPRTVCETLAPGGLGVSVQTQPCFGELDTLLAEAVGAQAAGTGGAGGGGLVVASGAAGDSSKRNKGRPSYTHVAMIDLMLTNPGISQNQIAAHFGYTAAWICTMMASDAFQALYAERQEKLVDPIARAQIKANFEALTLRSQELLAEKLNGPVSSIPDNLVLRSLDISARAAGYGAKDSEARVKVDIGLHLESMGENLTKLLTRRRAAIEHDAPHLEQQ